MIKHCYSLLLLLFVASAHGTSATPLKRGKQKILVNASFMERDNQKDLTILRDNVQVIFEQTYISCNEAIVLWSKNEVIAVGNVLMKSGKSTIQADKIIFNYNDDKGKIYGGVVLSGQVLLQGEYIEKTGPDTYIVNDAYLTSCTTCPSSWSFTADKIEATVEGYAYISNPWLNFLEFPSLYFPYLVLPLKNERQTGILTPSFGQTTRDGFTLELPFFWAINRSQDLTITPRYLHKREGVQIVANYRYLLSEKSGGEFNGAWIKDHSPNYKGKDRWFGSYAHYLELPHNYIQRSTVNLASDMAYTRDFQYQFNYVGESALDNRTSITKNYSDAHLSIDTSYYLSLIQPTIAESKENSVHRLPEIRFSVTDKKISESLPFVFKFDTQYINLSRQGLGYDAQQSDGSFRPIATSGTFNPTTDKVRTGQRLDLQPYLYAPLRLFNNRIDFTPFVSYRYTQYLLGAQSDSNSFDVFPSRNYMTYGMNTSTEFSRIFSTSSGTLLRHSIIPEISFQNIPFLNQTVHPLFGSQNQIPFFMETQPLQDQDLLGNGRGLQFDYEDRVIGRRLLNFSVSNRVVTKNNFGGYDQAFLFRVSQAYDMIEAKNPTGALPWQDLRTLTSVRWRGIDSITETFTFPYHKVTNINTRLRAFLTESTFADIVYSNYLNIPARPEDVDFSKRRESILMGSGFAFSYFQFFGQVEYSVVSHEIKRWLLNTSITPPGNCWSIDANLFQTLGTHNFGTKVNLNFLFGK